MDTMNFIMTKKDDVYNDQKNFDKELNTQLINNYDNLTKEEQELFFINNTRLVAFEVKKINGESSEMYDELMSSGFIGLHKAIKNYDKKKGYVFASFASTCIRNEILMFLRKEKKHKNLTSLNYVLYEDDYSNLTIEDTISSDDNVNCVDEVYKKILIDKIIKLSPELNKRDIFILINYYGINNVDPKTLSQIAKKLGCSQSYVTKCKKKVLTKIRNNIED